MRDTIVSHNASVSTGLSKYEKDQREHSSKGEDVGDRRVAAYAVSRLSCYVDAPSKPKMQVRALHALDSFSLARGRETVPQLSSLGL